MNKDEEICAEITALLNYMLRSLGAKDLLKFLHRNTYLVDKYLKLKAQFKRKNQQCFKLYQRNVELEKQLKKIAIISKNETKEWIVLNNAVCNIAKILRQQCECCKDKQSELCNADCKIKVILEIIKKTKEGKDDR